MKREISKTLSIIMSALLMAGMLAACGNAGTPATTPPPASTAPSSAAPAVSTAPAEESWVPTKDISMLIGYDPGGGMDVMSRLLIPSLQKDLGVNVVPNNMPGSNSAVSAEYLCNEPADGYMLWAYSAGAVTFPATGLTDLYYKDIQMLAVTQGCNPLILVPADSPIKTMEQFIELIKAGSTTAANSGIGGIWHVPQMMVVKAAGGSTTYVPYNGGKASATAVAQKETDWGMSDLSEAKTFIKDGMLKPLCVYKTTDIELDGYGTIPSILKWLPDLKDIIPATNGFRGIGIKRGAPQNVIDTYLKSLKKAVTSDDFINATKSAGIDPMAVFGADAEKLVEEATKYACWSLYDMGMADRDPSEVGLTR